MRMSSSVIRRVVGECAESAIDTRQPTMAAARGRSVRAPEGRSCGGDGRMASVRGLTGIGQDVRAAFP